MAFQIEYLADHVDAIPALAGWHHAEWTAISPHLTVSDRVARLQARARRGRIPTGFVAVLNGSTEEAHVLGFARAYLFTFDKQGFYQRLGWSTLEDTTFVGHRVTVMVRELANQRILPQRFNYLVTNTGEKTGAEAASLALRRLRERCSNVTAPDRRRAIVNTGG